jgi:hypothetical protein
MVHRLGTTPLHAGPADVGAKAFEPYTADYFFYTKDHED